MDLWPGFEWRPLGKVPPGSVIFFRYSDVNYYALVVDPDPGVDCPQLVVFHPNHPMLESAGLLSGSAIGGLGRIVHVLPEARAVLAEPHNDLEDGYRYVAAGSLIVMHDELAIVCYVSERSKGAYSIRTGAHLGEARANEYYKSWWLEARDEQSYRRLVKITARPRN